LVTCLSANLLYVSSNILEPKGTRVCEFRSNYGSGKKREFYIQCYFILRMALRRKCLDASVVMTTLDPDGKTLQLQM
jgi:hypothetical protein